MTTTQSQWPDAGLDLALYPVNQLEFGKQTRWSDRTLIVDKSGLEAQLSSAAGAESVEIDIARPGEPVRIVHILDAIEPRCKPGGRPVFPGFLSSPEPSGTGTTHTLAGMTVMVCAEVTGTVDSQLVSEAILDMAEPAAAYSPFSQTRNLVLTCHFSAGQGPLERTAVARQIGLLAARRLAEATLEATPEAVRHYALPPAPPSLPRVAYICPGMILAALHQTFLDGVPFNSTPVLIHPCELLDGAVVSGNYDIGSTRNPTYMYQRNPIVEELFGRHTAGELSFVGVILSQCLINPYLEKQRSASLAARMAKLAGANGAIVSIEECGHSYADLMLTCQACEDLGLRTVLVMAESAGGQGDKPATLAFAPQAAAIVSVGNMDQSINLPIVQRVIGGTSFVGRWPLAAPVHGPVDTSLENIFCANCQVGSGLLRGMGSKAGWPF